MVMRVEGWSQGEREFRAGGQAGELGEAEREIGKEAGIWFAGLEDWGVGCVQACAVTVPLTVQTNIQDFA